MRYAGARGQAILEIGTAGVLALWFLLAIIDFSRALYTQDQLMQAARLATRYASVNLPPPNSNCATAGDSCQNAVVDYVLSKTALSPSLLTTTIVFGGAGFSAISTPGGVPATTCATEPTTGCYVNVQFVYHFHFMLLPLKPRTFTTSSQITIVSQHP